MSGYGESYEYDPWGKVLKAPTDQVGAENPIRYAGYYYDTDTGLYYVKARYYSPDLGRWLTKDPDGGDRKDPQSINPYIYVDNDPVNKVDPDGHAWVVVVLVVVGGVLAIKGAYDNYMFIKSIKRLSKKKEEITRKVVRDHKRTGLLRENYPSREITKSLIRTREWQDFRRRSASRFVSWWAGGLTNFYRNNLLKLANQ